MDERAIEETCRRGARPLHVCRGSALLAGVLVLGCGRTTTPQSRPSAASDPPAPPAQTRVAVLTVDIAGQGSIGGEGPLNGAVSKWGCNTHCELRFDAGSTVKLTAEPVQNWTVDSWSGACSGPCSIRIEGTPSVAVHFKESPPPPRLILYDAQDVTHLGGATTFTDAQALDDAGAMAGTIRESPPAGTTPDVFLWDGALHRFPVPRGLAAAVVATAGGHVAGTLQTAEGVEHAFVTQGADLIELPTLGGNSFAVAVNSSGVVAGSAVASSGEPHAVVWENGALVDLSGRTGKPESIALAVDDSGNVGVLACDSVDQRAGCRARIVAGTDARELGAVPQDFASSAMNGAGDLVGSLLATAHGGGIAALWTAGRTSSLEKEISSRAWPAVGAGAGNDLSGSLRAANAAGDAVGEVDIRISEGGAATAIVWKGGALVDLAQVVSPAMPLHLAYAINAKGQILAQRAEFRVEGGLLLLTPRPGATAP